MAIQNIGLFNGMHAKMGFLNLRQQIYAQNVANADTPGFRPRDIEMPEFGRVMGRVAQEGAGKVSMKSTDPSHMPTDRSVREPDPRESKITYEASPDDNAVVLEEQIYKASKNAMEYQTITNLYRRNVGMLRTAVTGNR